MRCRHWDPKGRLSLRVGLLLGLGFEVIGPRRSIKWQHLS